ncbi:GNAT family N-acyltransferase [Ectothiorhodospira variabilis]|uniref:GNAT family N-acyltransferase n=1 Tax=Ectothiorhodospira variabilis TaxID=505694 RepID=UPI001EFA5C56|nr:GNAT family N-acyltransferase [Ectothiorhodospira variabilis]MCG5497650.1 GNAT family N-acetyltransferase [Ectothiorhodospira variabilis]
METGYEDPHAHPDGLERDEWDAHAIPFLVRHGPSGQWVGAMRLVPSVGGRLPLYDLVGADGDQFKTERAWEISRVCIPSAYRRSSAPRPGADSRPGNKKSSDVCDEGFRSLLSNAGAIRGMTMRPHYSWSAGIDSGECMDVRARRAPQGQRFRHYSEQRQIHSQIDSSAPIRVDGNAVIATLFRAAVTAASQRGGEALYFLVRPSLARLLHRLRFPVERAGQACEHRGVRFPYRAELGTINALGGSARPVLYPQVSHTRHFCRP